jgi:hypothetical protein
VKKNPKRVGRKQNVSEELLAAIDAAFDEGGLDLYRYAVVRCFHECGLRPVELAAMKAGYFLSDVDGSFLQIPLANESC